MKEAPQFSSGVARLASRAMLLCVLVDFALIAFAATGADSPLRMPDGATYVVEAAAPLLAYGLISFRVPAVHLAHRQPALRQGTSVGLVGGVLHIIHLALETFGNHLGENSTITLVFMLGGFLLWGFAGYRVTRETGDIKAGMLAGCWSAMVSVLMVVTFGLVLMSMDFPSPAYVSTWSEFKASGWPNARAFNIANTFEAVLSHLVIGPIAGAIFGVLGIGIAKLQPVAPK